MLKKLGGCSHFDLSEWKCELPVLTSLIWTQMPRGLLHPWTFSHLQPHPWPPASFLREGGAGWEREGSVLHITGNLFKLHFYAELANWWCTGQLQSSDVFDLACTVSLKNAIWMPACKNEEISHKIWISSTFLKKVRRSGSQGLHSHLAAPAGAEHP